MEDDKKKDKLEIKSSEKANNEKSQNDSKLMDEIKNKHVLWGTTDNKLKEDIRYYKSNIKIEEILNDPKVQVELNKVLMSLNTKDEGVEEGNKSDRCDDLNEIN